MKMEAVCSGLKIKAYVPLKCWYLPTSPHSITNQKIKMDNTFMELDMNVMPLEVTPPSYFLIFYHQKYQHGGETNCRDGSNTSTI
jgi:hypothetical protein